MSAADDPEVLVAGAGPTGLALACALTAAGVRVRVLDRAEGPAVTSRANILHARGAEVLDRLGALGGVREQAVAPAGLRMYVRGEHLATMAFVPDERESVQALYVSQAVVERGLRDRLAALGVAVEWGSEVAALARRPGGVAVGTGDGTELAAAWLVGCDGARSRVRELAGIGFPGVPVVERFLLADVHVDGLVDRAGGVGWYHRDGILMGIPMAEPTVGPAGRGTGNLWRLMADVPDDGRHLSADDVVAAFAGLLGTRAGLAGARIHDAVWTSVFRIQRRLADRYRSGRVLLAGDAAHVHSPFGGQGMNTGIGDAENLAWKLALVVGGGAAESLLDTYGAERRPVAAAVLRRTTANTRALVAPGRAARFVRDHVLIPILDRPGVQRRATRTASQLDLTYRRGPLGGRGRAPRPGDRVPDRAVVTGDGARTTLTALLGPRWVLLGAVPDRALRVLQDRLPGVVVPASDPYGTGRDALLVRPDGHLLWRGTGVAGLDRVLSAAGIG
ncbi:FAD-dependent monooxygenase [Pseudonocardia sp. HH130630-07]|uniref:FAD-dependent monooxygenase n=1 Tax=Pseudonocardia sp. HH130630-07 TaxID=1690815 RepID=UPI000814E5F2|nr:FAD-dependent monooxygenase [Pseudonocardia sp. HH130630-07]ANY08473.1 oxygenase [Pseudonocardia sp. HH130630-07]